MTTKELCNNNDGTIAFTTKSLVDHLQTICQLTLIESHTTDVNAMVKAMAASSSSVPPPLPVPSRSSADII